MLGDSTVFPTIAVNDIARAKDFYTNKLGLKEGEQHPAGITYECGTCRLFIYQSPTAGTSRATCAAWSVDDVEQTVEALTKNGVQFEHYDIPGAEVDGYVYTMGIQRAAWFKDPDGNILSITS